MAAHKNPNLSILQLGGGPSMTSSILSAVAKNPLETPWFSNFVVADINASVFHQFDKTFQAWGPLLTSTVLEGNLTLREQKLDPASFDLVIAAASFNQQNLKTEFLKDVQNRLHDGGLALILESETDVSRK